MSADVNDGGIGSKGGMEFSRKACTRRRYPAGRWTDTVKAKTDPQETKRRVSRTRLAGAGTGGRGMTNSV